jgi:hypothetical protein
MCDHRWAISSGAEEKNTFAARFSMALYSWIERVDDVDIGNPGASSLTVEILVLS